MASASDPLVQELLRGRRIATLATENPDGSIHLVAVWFLFDNGTFYVGTNSGSRKARNVAERGRASLMVDSRRPGLEKGVTAMGRAELLRDAPARDVVQRIQQRYMDESGVKDPRLGGTLAQVDDVAIKLVPEKWVSWDMEALGQAVFEGKMAQHVLPLDV